MRKNKTLLPEVIFNHLKKNNLIQPLFEERLDKIAAHLFGILIDIKKEKYLLRLRKHDHSVILCILKFADPSPIVICSLDAHQYIKEKELVAKEDFHCRFPKTLGKPGYPTELLPVLLEELNSHLPKQFQIDYPLYLAEKEGIKEIA